MIQIRSTAELGKSLSVKREKDGDDVIVACHLKFADLFCDREQFDEICRQPIGWHGAFFDELGAPVNVFDIGLPLSSWSVTGRVKGGDSRPEELRLLQATLSGVSCRLTKLGALLSGALSWKARGDEVEDLTELLGCLVSVDWQITDGGQQDLLAARTAEVLAELREAYPKATRPTAIRELGIITKSAEVCVAMQKGYTLIQYGDNSYRLERVSEDNTAIERLECWLQAAKGAIKRGLKGIGEPDDEYGSWRWDEEAA